MCRTMFIFNPFIFDCKDINNKYPPPMIIESKLNGRIKSWKHKYDESHHNQTTKRIHE